MIAAPLAEADKRGRFVLCARFQLQRGQSVE